MSGRKKELKITAQKTEKRYKTNSYSSDHLCPVWIFDKLDKNGIFKFDVSSSCFNHKDFLAKMISYSTMTWTEIKKQTHDNGKSKHHFLELDKLSKTALERVEKFGYDKLYPSSIFFICIFKCDKDYWH